MTGIQPTIAVAGNPNCGKSALFNRFTGIRQKTGNWPGVTVDCKEGQCEIAGTPVTIVDLPGIYSLDAASIDEEITRDYLLSRDARLVVNVIDASNLERNLYMTVQLLEMGVPVIVALNMMDVARKRGIALDVAKLSRELKCPVVPIVAVSGEGIDELKHEIHQLLALSEAPSFQVNHEDVVEQAITELMPTLTSFSDSANSRWLALKLLEGDSFARGLVDEAHHERIAYWQRVIEQRSGEESDIHIADARYGHAHVLAQQVIKEKGRIGTTFSDRVDAAILNRYLGIPIFLFVMYLMFMFTINVGSAFIDFFDGVAGALFVDGLAALLAPLGLPEWLLFLLTQGLGGGIQVVATFIPIVTCLYLFLSILEDTGYMARAAFVMDRAMRTIGLPGKAFVPLIVGFGCNVPAVMATRTLENPRERKLTILMNPFMSCGARLPVYALFVAAFFPVNGQNLVFALYLIGILVAILTGLIMRRTLLVGDSTGFMMELPPYHVPTLRGVMLRTWDRVRSFIHDAGKVIIIMVLALNVLSSIGSDGSFGHQDSDKSVLSIVGQELTPIFTPMGIEQDNWPATVGIFTGVLAKEAVVGSLDSIYSQIAVEESGQMAAETAFDFLQAISDAAATVPENLAGLSDMLLDPLGVDVGDVSDQTVAAGEQGVSVDIFGAMASRFDGQAGAFAYLLFILLYSPCVATMGAISRETDSTWAAFVAAWTTGVAYTLSTLFYQVATFNEHPVTSTIWILALFTLSIAVTIALRSWGARGERQLQVSEVTP